MKILIINVVCGIRSTGRICTDLAQILEKQGHTVKIAYGREMVPIEYKKYAVRIGSDISVSMDALLSRVFDNAGFNNIRQTRKFLEWVREYDPDVIHLNNIHGYYINVKYLFTFLKEYGKQPGKRIIWTLHDCWAFTGHSALCDGSECMRWQEGCYKCPQMKEYPRAFIDRSAKNWNNKRNIFQGVSNLTIITPSHWLKEWVKKSYLREYPVTVIPNGIDLSVFYPRSEEQTEQLKKKYNLQKKKVLLAVATTWTTLKGFNDYIQLSKMLDDNYRIVMIGGKSKRQKAELSELFVNLGKRIIDLDRTGNQEEMVLWYNISEALVNLTYCDTYPTVNVEAVACGTPVITYRTGGIPYCMLGYGKVIAKGDINAVYDCIINNTESSNIKDKHQVTAIDLMDKDRALCKYVELIQN